MRSISVLALTTLLAAPNVTVAQGRADTAADTTFRVVDRVFAAWRDTNRPGCALGVSRAGRVIYERGYGMANLETGTPIQPSSIFHVASVSKQFTAMAIMLLARDGKLSVDDNIRKYVPEIPDYGTPITIRHLLTHTSGLRDQWELLALARGRFEEDRITEADVMDIVPRQKALNFTPGAEYAYSNTGFTLLGVIVKRVSGKSLRDFADERIFKPLDMTSTHFHDDYTMLVPGRTSAYAPRGASWRVSIPNYDTYGATSLFTTVGDLLKWEANFETPVVGDRALLEQMQAPTPLTNGDTSSYGFGLVMGRYRGARVIEHNGADAGYRSYAGRFPEHGLAIAIACNAASANTTALAHGVADAYLGSLLAPAAVQADVSQQSTSVSPAMLERYAGVFIQPTTLQVLELTMRDGRLIVGRGDGPPLAPMGQNRFRGPQGAEFVFADGGGPRAGFELRPPAGGRPVRFEWRQPAAASAKDLARYAGEYFSEELNARYRVTANDSVLTFSTGTSPGLVARIVFADTFVGDGYTIQFTRSGAGGGVQPTGFEVTNGRVRHVKFSRVSR